MSVLHLVPPSVEPPPRALDPELRLRHLRNLTSSMLSDALSVWAEVQSEFEGVVHSGNLVEDAGRGFVPRCGWPEFLERMRVLEHYLTHTQRIVEDD